MSGGDLLENAHHRLIGGLSGVLLDSLVSFRQTKINDTVVKDISGHNCAPTDEKRRV